ncbi:MULTISPECIES: ABC transporter permease [Peptoniphilus]|jgi:dipeptide ABC superfamily ATP binding cassette transporter, membrane protein dppC|uniref:ABC transporter permease n=2 Tax=Peptoniphilaceae TaxID=1570339 RepID=UPI0008DAC0A0|nr:MULTISPECIES: ABC transporter permease [Peptoniphilus]MBS6610491.1 ABC transporter permease [Peptoniphilus harei]MDU1043032.1 ABC transporter permease [Peptoniphilus rhinitidis]MDU2114751.1 ABC transporter permease [Peptoniphilus lacydonensis]MDU5377455.1 ABC transporter permease [Peptoniphilus lacydonensis]MDU5436272.1 ABC transporter permease [Peptoniphilus lacydonensis]
MKKRLKNFFKYYSKNKVAVVALVILILIIIVAIFADVISPYDYTKQYPKENFLKPGSAHLMGTDNFGRDIFSRVLHGAKVSLKIGFTSVIISTVIGVIIGAFAGYYEGIFDAIIMRIMDTILSIPQLVLAIALAAALGGGMKNLILAVSLSSIPSYARIVRSQVLSVKNLEYVEAAKLSGVKTFKLIFTEILPNCFAPIIVQATIGVGTAILSAASLSFIGMGIMPPEAEWGQMLSEGRAYIRNYPYMTFFPGLAIAITILVLNVVGDALRDTFDPKFRR